MSSSDDIALGQETVEVEKTLLIEKSRDHHLGCTKAGLFQVAHAGNSGLGDPRVFNILHPVFPSGFSW